MFKNAKGIWTPCISNGWAITFFDLDKLQGRAKKERKYRKQQGKKAWGKIRYEKVTVTTITSVEYETIKVHGK